MKDLTAIPTKLKRPKQLQITILLSLFLLLNTCLQAQSPSRIFSNAALNSDPFGHNFQFVENLGQYGEFLKEHPEMGSIKMGYEGWAMPVLFTEKGVIYLQREVEWKEERDREKAKGKNVAEEEGVEHEDMIITAQWIGANPHPAIIGVDAMNSYHTYASISGKAKGFQKIIYKELYPGIDLIYSFVNNKNGFEYSLLLHPGADINNVKLAYGGDIKSMSVDAKGSLLIRSGIGTIEQSKPASFYAVNDKPVPSAPITSSFQKNGNEIRFSLPASYDKTRAVLIDPFVSGTGNLTGLNAGKAKDVDFDYDGNIYVTGGGSGATTHQLAKYDPAGNLLWTFNGVLTVPSWTFGTYYGGWMVEKPTGKIYLGQGFNPSTGFMVIRVSPSGLYDNFITSPNPNFREAWKMYWSCNNGSPQILVAGGGTNSNINFGVFVPPSTSIGSLNVTGIPYTGSAGWAQDIVDFIIDPTNNDMYTIYGSLIGNPPITNRIYKNTFPYSGGSVAWNVASGFVSVQEIANRPYMAGGTLDNSANIFALNANYLFYWDGKNLKAFNKATGAGVGTPLSTGSTVLMQGGIVADACNNVFVGEGNGVIKVYQFDGSTFNDAAAPDINIPGYAGKGVYDLAYDESRKLIYASGDGFVASFDISSYCASTQYTINVVPDCLTGTATATLSPAPPAGSIVSYSLYIGTQLIATNTTGLFSGLRSNITYTIKATINQACSGSQATVDFVVPGPLITVSTTNTTCGNSTGTITASGSGSTPPYTYSIDGVTYQASGNFAGLAAGLYTLTVKDLNGCKSDTALSILNTNGPSVTVTIINALCGTNNGSITVNAIGGTPPYQYSLNGGGYQLSNVFVGLAGGNYTVAVKDGNNCINTIRVTISSSPQPFITAVPASATCGGNNGSITAFGSGGTAPLQYSINGTTYQGSNVFNGLAPGNYTVYVKDALGCIQTTNVTINNSPAPTVTATSSPATCNNANGTITANGNGGISPLQYSLNNVSYQTNNIFTGIAAGVYTVYVKDAVGCVGQVSVTVSSTSGPTASATSTNSSCASPTGTITITGTGGATPYTYSINGVTFQASNVFSGLAPGNYVAYVKDNAGCIGAVNVVVAGTAGPSINAVATPTSCASNTGIITCTGSGGVPPLTYSIDNITYQASNIFSGLGTGIYTVWVKDANTCTRSTTVTITNSSNLTLNASSLSSACNGSSGTITAIATGGIAPLQYSLNGTTWQSSNVFTGIAPGNYTVYVRDANNCTVTRAVTVTTIAGPSVTVSILQQATCNTANAAVRANGSGGNAPLTYSLDGGAFQASNFFLNIAVGVHNIVVKDATNCLSAPASFTITNTGSGTPPTDVTFRIVNTLPCLGGFGRIKNLKGVPSGGGNTYVFSLDGGAFTTANQFTNVPPGTHTITARNQSGCTITKLAVIGTGAPATATATATATPCGSSTGTITITGVGANTPYHASIDNGATWVTFFPPGANSFTFTGLGPGTYPILIADDADFVAGPPDNPGVCISTIYVSVPSTGGPLINTSSSSPTCLGNNGTITVSGSGGTPPYTYNINNGPFGASGVFSNLGAGTYAVNVKDATGCTNGANITLTAPTPPSATATVVTTSCNENNGSITVTGTGGTAPYQYSIDGTSFQTSNVFSNLAAGTYTLYIKDVNNCYSSSSVVVGATAIPRVTAFPVPANCGSNNGVINASGTGGTLPYVFSLDGTTYQSSGQFTNLAPGTYTIYLKDARDCVTTTTISLTVGGGGPGPIVIYHN